MSLARYFSRSSIAAAQVLKRFDDQTFRTRMSRCTVAVAFDAHAASCPEGATAIDLAVDLLARFYPILAFVALDDNAATIAMVARSRTNARQINAHVDRDGNVRKAAFCIVVGRTPLPDGAPPRIFAGSDGWLARLSPDGPVGCGSTGNPFGAAAATCIAVANAFRAVFADQLEHGAADGWVELDVLNMLRDPGDVPAPLPAAIELRNTHLVGLGAIGRATAWTLARVPGLAGVLHLVDHQTIELSNLQRYVGTKEKDEGRVKVTSAAAMFAQTGLRVVGHQLRWGEYLAERGDCDLDTVAAALDTAGDRMAVQASLPRRLLNAWTQPGDLGVSRHGFGDGPCLMCLYLPTTAVPSESELVAAALHLPEEEIRPLLYRNAIVERSLAQRIAAGAGIDYDAIARFVGRPLRSFYSEAVCGTTVFGAPEGGSRGAFAVPMAFQSALAGVMLAAEIVADATGASRSTTCPTTKVNLMRPIGRLLNEPASRNADGHCICHDAIYLDAYNAKFRPPTGGGSPGGVVPT